MKIDLTGQRALVTGGTRGIGRAVVDVLVECGAAVVATGTKTATLEELSKVTGVTALRMDLANRVETAQLASDLSRDCFDILINNAGINVHARVGELDLEDFDRILDVNLRGTAVLCRGIVPGMVARGYGRIVSVTSIFSCVSKAARAPYATSKFAVLGFTKTLALDYADTGVLANCVAPGFIETEMTERMLGPSGSREMVSQVPMGRLGKPSEVAALIAFLASPLNTFINGQNIAIDGGFTST